MNMQHVMLAFVNTSSQLAFLHYSFVNVIDLLATETVFENLKKMIPKNYVTKW